jgi:uncharacterized membrane protein
MKRPTAGREPQKKPDASKNNKVVQLSAAAFAGPLPHPSLLEQYNRVISNGAERIMRMAEQEGEHRHYIEKRLVDAQASQLKLGSIFAFVLGMTTVVGGLVLLYLGKDIGGLGSLIAGLGAIVVAFIAGSRRSKS